MSGRFPRLIRTETDPLPPMAPGEGDELRRGARPAGPVSSGHGAAEAASGPSSELRLTLRIPRWRMAVARQVQRACGFVIRCSLRVITAAVIFAARGAQRVPQESNRRVRR